ncbi:MAG: GntR family transcriptional regulator [Oscillospiraceae bacterium]|jgi:GntR family transcriptional regulator|nr:GntR family transcriptional regulator [Oscillospiraceae bacterium]
MTGVALFSVDKATPVPLYYQLKMRVQGMIDSGALRVGDMLPPENDLCEHLGVSRPTVRQAMSELVAEGWLTRRKGKGTFVSQPKIDVRFLQKLESFNDQMTQKGLIPSTRVLSLRKAPGVQRINDRLLLTPDEPLICLMRLRFGDGEPVVCVDTYLPFARFPAILDQDFERASLYERLEALYGTRVCRAHREIEAANANRREAELLCVEAGQAVCLVKTLGYGQDDAPVEYSVARYRGDRNKFSIDLYR